MQEGAQKQIKKKKNTSFLLEATSTKSACQKSYKSFLSDHKNTNKYASKLI